ncbi:flagellar biosynthetic protein FliO [Erwinia sp. CGal63]|uniref:flagellar biosynthetic protein FliO n=1 Tax=Erwinia sp. CGal63 TaxID=2919889 RepID=UPI003FA5B216
MTNASQPVEQPVSEAQPQQATAQPVSEGQPQQPAASAIQTQQPTFAPVKTGQTQQPAAQPVVSTGSVLTQVSSVLAVIILLILACAWLTKRLGFAPKTGKRGQRDLSISASCQVGQRERVVIVDVQDARLVLGVTAQQITHLHTLPPAPAQENPEEPQPAGDFRQVLELIKRAGKPK